MNAIQLRPYQSKAIDAIQEAINRKQKHIVVEIATGCGKSIVLAKTIEVLSKENLGNILVLVDRAEVKDILFSNCRELTDIDSPGVTIETAQEILRQQNIKANEYS